MLSHSVDATLLGQSEAFRDILKSSTVVLDVIGWQFPFNGKEEDTVGNTAMVAAFLRGVSAAAWRHVHNTSAYSGQYVYIINS